MDGWVCAYRRVVDGERITVDPEQLGGVPCIRGLRIPVGTAVGMLEAGATIDDVLRELPELTLADVHASLRHVRDQDASPTPESAFQEVVRQLAERDQEILDRLAGR